MTRAISPGKLDVHNEREIIVGQSYTEEFKQQVIQESRETGNAAMVARRYQLSPSMVRRWTRTTTKAQHQADDVMTWVDENERLKRLLGEKDLQLAVLQDLLRKKGIRP